MSKPAMAMLDHLGQKVNKILNKNKETDKKMQIQVQKPQNTYNLNETSHACINLGSPSGGNGSPSPSSPSK